MFVELIGEKVGNSRIKVDGVSEYDIEFSYLNQKKYFEHLPEMSTVSLRGRLDTPTKITKPDFFFVDMNAIRAVVDTCSDYIISKKTAEDYLLSLGNIYEREREIGKAASMHLENRRKIPTSLFGPNVLSLYGDDATYRDMPFFRTERLLYTVNSKYRDHVIHTFNVYIAGAVLLSHILKQYKEDQQNIFRVTNEHPDTRKCYHAIAGDNPVPAEYRIGTIWFYTALFHDLGYTAEKVTHEALSWLFPLFEGVLKREKGPLLSLAKNPLHLSATKDGWDVDLSDALARFHGLLCKSNNNIWESSSPGDYAWPSQTPTKGLAKLLKKKAAIYTDHGVIGSAVLMRLLSRSSKEYFEKVSDGFIHSGSSREEAYKMFLEHVLKQDCLRAALAVALHNLKYWKLTNREKKAVKDLFPYKFNCVPFAFTLSFLDEVFDWWRPRDISQSFGGGGISWNIFWEEKDLVFHQSLKYMSPSLLKKILIDIHDSSHLSDKSLRGKIDMELVQFLSGKNLNGTNPGKAKLSMTGSKFRLRIDITMPSFVVSQIAVGSFLYSMRSMHERITYELFEDEKDAKLLEACKQWIHPELEASDKDIVVSFKI